MALSTIGSEAVVQAAVGDAIRRKGRDVKGLVFQGLLLAGLLLSLLVLVVLITTVFQNGGNYLRYNLWDFLNQGLSSRPARAGVSQGLRGSFWIAVCVAGVAFPVGIGAAVYLEEYARPSRFTRFIEVNIRNLAGVPSVVYGLLGLAVFVNLFGGFVNRTGVETRTLLTAGLTLAVLVLPVVIITSSEAIRAVPDALREGAYGVGATKWDVIRTQVLPYAAPGILTGTLLSLARAIGEAAPLIILGAVTGLLGTGKGLDQVLNPSALFERYTAMPNIVSEWSKDYREGFPVTLSAAAIIVLLAVVVMLNTTAILLRNHFEKKRNG